VALVRTDIPEEHVATIIRMTRIGELGTALTVDALHSSETSVLTRVTRHHIPEDGILHSQHRENLKAYIALTDWAL
jgi:hypothetical protein